MIFGNLLNRLLAVKCIRYISFFLTQGSTEVKENVQDIKNKDFSDNCVINNKLTLDLKTLLENYCTLFTQRNSEGKVWARLVLGERRFAQEKWWRTDRQTYWLTERGPYKSPSGIRTLDLQIRSECFNSLRSASRKKTMLDSMNQNCHNI